MPWDRETLTQEARLLVSNPQEVFRELKVYGERIQSNPFRASSGQLGTLARCLQPGAANA